MTHIYKVTGMTCNGCKVSVEKHLNALPNIINASVNLEESEAKVEMLQQISIKQLQEVLPEKFLISEKIKKDVFSSSKIVEQKSDFQQLKPLFLILGYITIVSILLNSKNWDWNNFMLDFMGIFYLVFSFAKILDLKGFPESFKMYDPLAKVIPAYALVYPFIELTLSVLFLTRIQIPLALIITIIILGITTIGVTKSLLNKKKIQCACLGTVLKLPMTKATFIENLIMIIMAIIMLKNLYV